MRKYKLTEETKVFGITTLHRIEALIDIENVVLAGEKGGWIENEANLSHEGKAWVADEAKVYDCATVSGNALVSDNAQVLRCAKVCGDTIVCSNATVTGYANVYDHAHVCGYAHVGGHATVHGNSNVINNAIVTDHADISGDAVVMGYTRVTDNAKITGKAGVNGFTFIVGDAVLDKPGDYITFNNHFSSLRHFTWTRSNNKWSVGCFHGTDEELIEKARADNEAKGEYYKAYVDFKNRLLELDKKYGVAGAKDKLL